MAGTPSSLHPTAHLMQAFNSATRLYKYALLLQTSFSNSLRFGENRVCVHVCVHMPETTYILTYPI